MAEMGPGQLQDVALLHFFQVGASYYDLCFAHNSALSTYAMDSTSATAKTNPNHKVETDLKTEFETGLAKTGAAHAHTRALDAAHRGARPVRAAHLRAAAKA